MGTDVEIDLGLDLVAIEGGSFAMGSTAFYREEAPVVQRTVAPFELARTPVTNAQFAAFVAATGYVTTAERPLDPADFPGAVDLDTTPGSLVFTPTEGPVDLRDWRQWWRWVPGASWRAPRGPEAPAALDGHPVVQVSFEDAVAFCEWAGVRLPTEEEWELAARGGLDGATYTWGEEPQHVGALKANTWQGDFPWRSTGANGWVGTSPVGVFPPNGFGLLDMAGNVWEWTSTRWTDRHEAVPTASPSSCGCSPAAAPGSDDRVAKGGSHLCAPEYCLRYRPAARTRQSPDSATTHMGFRVARSQRVSAAT